MIDWLITQIQTNVVFSGLVGASSIGGAVYLARNIPAKVIQLIRFAFTIHLKVYNDDDAFQWINEWLARHPYTKKARRLKLSTHHDGREETESSWSLSPGEGRHIMTFCGRLLILEREVVNPEGGGARVQRVETISITLLSRNLGLMRRLIDEARNVRDGERHLNIFRYSGYWARSARRLPRPLNTVSLPTGQLERIVADAEEFYNSRDWYEQRGVPWRRGYLLEGPPGTGKTTLAMALASHLDRPLYVLNLGSVGDDGELLDAFATAPARGILLIEDIDGTDASHVRSKEKNKEGAEKIRTVTISALLNAIDGAFAVDGRLLLMTTNRPEVLDPALLRAGRVDLKEHFGMMEQEQADEMFTRFFPGLRHKFVLGPNRSPVGVQEVLLRHKGEPDEAAKELDDGC